MRPVTSNRLAKSANELRALPPLRLTLLCLRQAGSSRSKRSVVVGERIARSRSPPPRPSSSCSHWLTLHSLSNHWRRRTCDPTKLDKVDRRNGLNETEMEDNLEYLVLGHFEKNDRDVKGYDDTVWLTLTELEEAQQLSEQDLDAHLEQWERESARMRHARARARARPA